MRWLIAFTITIVVYMALIWLYIIGSKNIQPIEKSNKKDNIIKISLRNITPPKMPIKKQKKVVPHKKVKKIKKKIKKKIVKKKIKKKVVKKKIKKRDKPKIKEEKQFIPESEIIYIPNPIFEETISSNEIANKKKESYPNSKIEKLYGKEFHSYTPSQKKFIEQNLDEIHQITQNRLWQRGYPGGELSARTGQEGTNIVSFYLHPNGDISDLRLKQKVGYRILDDNTIETIKSAYKDYPYPSEKTKMIFFVEYSIFGY